MSFDKARCQTSVPDRQSGFHFHQCSRKIWKDDTCRQHHPDTVAKRRAAKVERWNKKTAAHVAPYVVLEEQQQTIKRYEKALQHIANGWEADPQSVATKALKPKREREKA